MNVSPSRRGFWKFSLQTKSSQQKKNEHRINRETRAENEQYIELLKGAQNGGVNMQQDKNNFINMGEEDQMEIIGYAYDVFKFSVTWFWIISTCGILRLIYHWYPHLYLKSTYRKVPLSMAQKILVIETYQDKHTSYHVKDLKTLTPNQVMRMEKASETDGVEDISQFSSSDIPLSLSVHFGGGVFKKVDKLSFFTCKKVIYIWNQDENKFVKLRGLDASVTSNIFHEAVGLTSHEQFTRKLVYGPNHINVPEKGVITLLFLEVLNPFYIFQIASFILWFCDEYYQYATAILLMSIFGIVMSIIQTMKNQRNLKSTVHSSDIATVLRPRIDEHGMMVPEHETISTEHLVPGDILEIPPHGCTMQCDAVLLTGNCILNEAMLTGESVPVTKTPIANSVNIVYDSKEHARHTLFSGTKVLQTRYIGDEKVLAIVIRTGFSTSKGGLVRSILYPPPVDFRFEKDSYRFIVLLAIIASVGFIYTVITKVLKGVGLVGLIVEALDLITIVVPPALPAAMTVGRMYAQRCLKRNNIFCISPRTINVSGSIDCVCFDKTGTLTEDGLDMLCIVPIVNRFFQVPIKDIANMAYDVFMYGMVTCHSITVIDGEMRGDPLDLKMFESTKWTLEEPDISDNTKFDTIFPTIVRPPPNRQRKHSAPEDGNAFNRVLRTSGGDNNFEIQQNLEIGILREFPFSSTLQRMSVIVRKLGAPYFEYFCKGSPEMILTLVSASSVPDDFHETLEMYTQQGYRVIALAHKVLHKMSYTKIQRASREMLECDLNLVGLIILENRLKPQTTPVIKMLNSAQIRTIMVTGDNLLTALSVAKECKIITDNQRVITIDAFGPDDNSSTPEIFFLQSNSPKNYYTEPHRAQNGGICLPNSVSAVDYSILSSDADNSSVASLATIESCTVNTDVTNSIHIDIPPTPHVKNEIHNTGNYRFAMTGKSWSVARRYFPDLIPRIATRGVVFARMSPDQKQSLIQELQALGYYVAMVGDGANDVGALRSAHCGISLSDTESSVASPFTSKTPNITAITSVISHGRAALVTSFSIFKYMAAYSLTQFISVMLLYSIESNLTDLEFLYIDLFVITVFAYFFGKSEAYTKKIVPERPLNSLIGLTPVLSLIIQMILVGTFQLIAFIHLKKQPWYVPFDPKDKEISVGCVENFTIFTVSSFQYIILAVVFSKGKPHRKPMWTNLGFILSAIGLTIFSLYLALIPSEFFTNQFELVLPNRNDTLHHHPETLTVLPNHNITLENSTVPLFDFISNTTSFNEETDVDIWDINPFQYMLIGYALLNFIIASFMEYFFLDFVVFKKLRHMFHDINKSKKKFLKIESELKREYDWPILSDNFNLMSRQKSRQEDACNAGCNLMVEQTNAFSAENKILDCFVEDNPNNPSIVVSASSGIPGSPAPIMSDLGDGGDLINQIQTPNRFVKKNSEFADTRNGTKSMLELDTFKNS
ncbi:polyamine-transporting ATPase 13A3 isoform X2 [Chrysoperla carnea]|uniref:polyamine-transporting ATPase 13A3 isoform X2 n=1 Tax=Chrysoperla carnea TaxID=189513 RepID=UPI001D06CFD6|nr:polyamine-transporting ATPase 13A3 isoform X2 [Chrysoperla carnea]